MTPGTSPGTPPNDRWHNVDLLAYRVAPRPRAALVLARLLIVFFCVVATALVVVPWQQSARGAGRVIAYAPLERQQFIAAPVEGRIMHWHVAEGTHVKAGDPVVEVSDIDPTIIERLQQERAAVQARRTAAEERARAISEQLNSLSGSRSAAVSAAESRARMAVDRLRAAEQAVHAAEVAHKTALLNLNRQRALEAKRLAATRAVELAELEETRTRTDLERAKASLHAATAEKLAFQNDTAKANRDGTASMDNARATRATALAEVAAADAELARIEVRLTRQRAQTVTAPRNGTILRLLVNQGGEIIRAGERLAVLVPDTDDRAAEIWVSGRDAPLISEGRHVRLQFEGWPALQFSGWPSIAVGTFGGRVALVDATDDGQGRFRVLIVPDAEDEPWPEARYLRQGVRANGWVLLDQVSLGFELWRVFNGFPPALSGAPPAQASAPLKK
jgi:multidrug efflux pump subunit AcrA (membrane-fusion protein)